MDMLSSLCSVVVPLDNVYRWLLRRFRQRSQGCQISAPRLNPFAEILELLRGMYGVPSIQSGLPVAVANSAVIPLMFCINLK